jgi:hypothetical protein
MSLPTPLSRPRIQVAEFASNPDKATQWYVNIHQVDWQSPRPLQAGSRLAFKARFLGRDLAYVYEVVEYHLPDKFVMRTADGPFPMETTYTWESIEEGVTRMTLRNRGIPSGFSKWFAPLMSLMMKKANQKDLALLKKILESS